MSDNSGCDSKKEKKKPETKEQMRVIKSACVFTNKMVNKPASKRRSVRRILTRNEGVREMRGSMTTWEEI